MGIPSALSSRGTPPARDQANYVLSGTILAVGATAFGTIWGPMNLAIWASINTTLTTTSGSLTASVASATGLTIGDAINSPNVTAGTTIKNLVGTTVTLSAVATATGADTTAKFTSATISYVGNIQLERSFDGGATWIVCNIGGSGALAQWSAGTPVSLSFGEPEREVQYRLNCLTYSSGTINYRISATGQAAVSLSVPTL